MPPAGRSCSRWWTPRGERQIRPLQRATETAPPLILAGRAAAWGCSLPHGIIIYACAPRPLLVGRWQEPDLENGPTHPRALLRLFGEKEPKLTLWRWGQLLPLNACPGS